MQLHVAPEQSVETALHAGDRNLLIRMARAYGSEGCRGEGPKRANTVCHDYLALDPPKAK